jgi:hypothetical protein
VTIAIGNEQIISLTRRRGRSKGVAPIPEPSAQSGFVGMRTITAGSRSRVPAGREAGHVAVKVEEIDAQLRRTYTPLSARALIVPPLSMPRATAPCTISPSAVAPDRKGCGRAHGWITVDRQATVAVVTPMVRIAYDAALAMAKRPAGAGGCSRQAGAAILREPTQRGHLARWRLSASLSSQEGNFDDASAPPRSN